MMRRQPWPLDAAEQGDPLAAEIVERLGARFARIVSALAVLLDSERIVLAGGPPRACAAILPTVLRDLPRKRADRLSRPAALRTVGGRQPTREWCPCRT